MMIMVSPATIIQLLTPNHSAVGPATIMPIGAAMLIRLVRKAITLPRCSAGTLRWIYAVNGMLKPMPLMPITTTLPQNNQNASAGSAPASNALMPNVALARAIIKNCRLSPPVSPMTIAPTSIPVENAVCTSPLCQAVPLK